MQCCHRRVEVGAGGRLWSQVHRVADRQSLALRGIDGQPVERRTVADNRQPGTAGQRLIPEQRGAVEQLRDGVDLHDSRLRKQVSHDRAVHIARRLGGVATAAHRDDRLGPGHPARDPGELARVTETLQVEQHHIGIRVGVPILEQVVAGHVGAVAGRHERRQPEIPGRGLTEDGRPQRPGLTEEPDPPAAGQHRCQRRVERHLRIGVHDAERARPDHPHPVSACGGDQLLLGRPAGHTGRVEAGGEHDKPLDALGHTVVQHRADRLRRHRYHREVDLVGDLPHRRVGTHAAHRAPIRIHREHRTLEHTGQQVVQHRAAHPAGARCRADHRHRSRSEQIAHAARLGGPLARIPHGEQGFGGIDGEFQVQHRPVPAALHLIARVPEDRHHGGVLREHLGDEGLDLVLRGGTGQVLQQNRAEPAALMRVGHHERDLRGPPPVPVQQLIPAHRDDRGAEHQHQADPVVIVDMGGPVEILRRDPRVRTEIT
ncbi:hypothetical protein NONI108955_15615 [Nocardia ninae]